MGELDDYFVNEEQIKQKIAKKGMESSPQEGENDIRGSDAPTKEQEIAHSEESAKELTKLPSFELVFKANNNIRYSQLTRISSTTSFRLQKILLAKQLQGAVRLPMNVFVENIINLFLIENEKEIKKLEELLFQDHLLQNS
ncbi:MAG: hypothetical protein RR705_02890 [Lachnospiraceae bacterium]